MTSVTRAEGTEAASPIPVGVEGDAQAVTVAAAPVAPVSYLSLLLFYLPLGFSGLMMTLDLPVVNAILNRMPNPDTSVAALRVAFSMALVYEASHISMIDISTALSADRRMFDMLKRFYGIMALVLLVAASIIAFTPLYDLIVRGMMNIDAGVAEAARPAFWAFLLWPIPIGWRRLCQGALIRHGHPKPVGAGGLVRLGALVLGLILFGWLGTQVWVWEPAAIAVLAMLVSVTAEAVAVQGWTNKIIRTMPAESPGVDAPTLGQVWRFFFPLAGTAVMSTVSNPILTSGIATAALVWASPNGQVVDVAAYSIAWSMAFLVFGPTLSMTQASIAWAKSPDPTVRERGPRLIVGMGVVLALLIGIASLTPLTHWIFTTLLTAPERTAQVAEVVARLFIPMPILHAISFMLKGKLIAEGRPTVVRRAQLVDLVALVALILLATSGPFASLLNGSSAAPFAAIVYNLVLCVDIGMLVWGLRGVRRKT
ncbi:MAG: hypothetical protein WCD37_06890 [Chloroflexia bacterium]